MTNTLSCLKDGYELYRSRDIAKSEVVCICSTVRECDKLWRFGYAATTLIDEHRQPPPNWFGYLVPDLFPVLRAARIIVFERNELLGFHIAQTIANRVIDMALDVRIVKVPTGFKDIVDYMLSIDTAKAGHAALKKLIDAAPPITSGEAFEVYHVLENLKRLIEEEYQMKLVPLYPAFKLIEMAFLKMQKQESIKRARIVLASKERQARMSRKERS